MRFLFYIIVLFTFLPQAVMGQPHNKTVSKEMLLADSLDLAARKYMLIWKRDSAKYLLGKALEIAKTTGNSTIIARCYVDFAQMYLLQGNFSEARQYLQKGSPWLNNTDHYEVKIAGLLTRANIDNFSGRKDSALFYYNEAEKYNAQKMPYRNYVVYLSMGELYNQADDLAEAEKYFSRAYQLTSQKENKPDHSYVLAVLINFYRAKKNFVRAGAMIAEYNELEEERKKTGFADPLRHLMTGVGNIKLESDVSFMKQVKESTLASGQIQQAIIANGYIINHYEKKKDFETAVQLAAESERLAEKTGVLFNIYIAKKTKYNLLQKAGKYNEAALLADTLFVLKDSLLLVQKRDQLFELEKKYETEKKQNEISLLTSQSKLREKEIILLTSGKNLANLLLQKELAEHDALERENVLMDSIVGSEKAYSATVTLAKEKEAALNAALGRENTFKAAELLKEKKLRKIFIGGGVLLLLAGIVILFQYRRQKEKNAVIQKQADDLQVLMKEIHHRVKNNLQVISSLLDLQSISITDSQASAAVKEGKNRVQSMALIHQNLYNEGNIKGIRTRNYIQNLLQSLCDSYNITNDKVHITSQIDDLNLDVDTMIPLGLLLNELVSNSLKHAFGTGETGNLNVVLKSEPQYLLLKVSDDGKGFPENMNIQGGKSFGMKMIRAFAQKLKAKLDVYNNNGAVIEMRITKYSLA